MRLVSKNFSSGQGDMIALDTTDSAVLGVNAFDIGTGGIVDGVDLTNVADATARLAASLSNGGKGGFVYQEDTGGLYYSADGSFSGGGVLIGTITTNGTAAWAYDANSFMQV